MNEMKLYAIRRRGSWKSLDQLDHATAAASMVANYEMGDEVRWVRSYVVHEDDGSLGTVCLFEATSPEAILEHARRASLPVSEIVEVGETLVVRAEPRAA